MRANIPSAKTSKPIMNTREDSGRREELCSAQYLTLSASLTLHAFIFRTVLIVQDPCVLSCHCPETQREDMKADDSQFDELLRSEVCQNTIHNKKRSNTAGEIC